MTAIRPVFGLSNGREASVRNVAHDMKLPLKMIVGVRSLRASRAGKSADNCPHFAEKLVAAWELPFAEFDPETATPADAAKALQELAGSDGPRVLLWVE